MSLALSDGFKLDSSLSDPLELMEAPVASHTKSSDRPVETAPQRFQERHYSASEVGEMWNLSPDFVRKLFEHEPGVLVLGEQQTAPSKRRYTTIRIPESVLQRVHRRLCNP